jgi:hypothetical protein
MVAPMCDGTRHYGAMVERAAATDARRLWAIVAGVIAGLVASVVWMAAEHGGREDLAGLALYVVALGAVPFAVAWWQGVYIPLTSLAVLFALWLGLWGMFPSPLVALGLLVSLVFPAPRFDRRAIARPIAAVAVALLVVGAFALVVVPGDMRLVACVPFEERAARTAVFDVIDDPHVTSVQGADSPKGILLELENWPSDEEVDRIVRRLEAIPGVEGVGRDGSTRCR